MRQPDYRSGNRQMGFVPGMKPPRATQQNTAPMGLGQPAGQPKPAPAMPPTPPTQGPPPPPGPPMGGPPPAPPMPNRRDLERNLWMNRHSRNPVAVLADAYTQLLGQPPDYPTITSLLQAQGVDGALQTLLSADQGSLVSTARPTPVQRAILG